jgi:hypothetical protein
LHAHAALTKPQCRGHAASFGLPRARPSCATDKLTAARDRPTGWVWWFQSCWSRAGLPL